MARAPCAQFRQAFEPSISPKTVSPDLADPVRRRRQVLRTEPVSFPGKERERCLDVVVSRDLLSRLNLLPAGYASMFVRRDTSFVARLVTKF